MTLKINGPSGVVVRCVLLDCPQLALRKQPPFLQGFPVIPGSSQSIMLHLFVYSVVYTVEVYLIYYKQYMHDTMLS